MGYCPRAGILGTESAAKECDGNRKGKMMEERRKNTMILYRNLRYQQLFDDMCSLLKPEEGGARPDAYACASQLIESGSDLWIPRKPMALFPGILHGKQ